MCSVRCAPTCAADHFCPIAASSHLSVCSCTAPTPNRHISLCFRAFVAIVPLGRAIRLCEELFLCAYDSLSYVLMWIVRTRATLNIYVSTLGCYVWHIVLMLRASFWPVLLFRSVCDSFQVGVNYTHHTNVQTLHRPDGTASHIIYRDWCHFSIRFKCSPAPLQFIKLAFVTFSVTQADVCALLPY
jgi:hypothetical protein